MRGIPRFVGSEPAAIPVQAASSPKTLLCSGIGIALAGQLLEEQEARVALAAEQPGWPVEIRRVRDTELHHVPSPIGRHGRAAPMMQCSSSWQITMTASRIVLGPCHVTPSTAAR